jgi:transcriptional regulator with XRE-family HTH domain
MGEAQRFGETLARLRRCSGKSQTRLAEVLCELSGRSTVTRHEISRYERGVRLPGAFWLPYLAEALGVSVATLERAMATGRLPEEFTNDLGGTLGRFELPGDLCGSPSIRRGRQIGHHEVNDLAGRVHGLRLADDVLAGGDLIAPAFRELDGAISLYRESRHTEGVGRALLAQTGELAQIGGWIASDAGQHQQADRTYRLGISAAREAGDLALVGNLAGSLAYQLSNTGREDEGVVLAQAALHEAGPHAHPTARALYLDRIAWAQAQVGDSQAAMRALGRAHEALTEDSPDEAPRWAYWVSPEELQVMDARVYTELHRPLRAVPVLTEVLAGYDTTHARELALYLSWLAVALVDANEPEESAGVATRMLELASEVASERTVGRAHVVLAKLEPYSDIPEVRELFDRVAAN